jgi:tetratricopeptide (TPR) repeat protein
VLSDLILLAFLVMILAPGLVALRDGLRTLLRGNRFRRDREAELANPANADARYQLALIWAEGGRPRKAEPLLAEAIRLTHDNPAYDGVPHRYLRLQGDVLLALGRPAEAAEAYLASLKRPSELGYGDSYFGLGRAFQMQGRAEEALGWFQQAHRENGSRLETYFRMAQLAGALGRAGEERAAIDEFHATVRHLPRDTRERRLYWRIRFALRAIARV